MPAKPFCTWIPFSKKRHRVDGDDRYQLLASTLALLEQLLPLYNMCVIDQRFTPAVELANVETRSVQR